MHAFLLIKIAFIYRKKKANLTLAVYIYKALKKKIKCTRQMTFKVISKLIRKFNCTRSDR